MENHHFEWESSLFRLGLDSYVKLPEGIYVCIYVYISMHHHYTDPNTSCWEGTEGLEPQILFQNYLDQDIQYIIYTIIPTVSIKYVIYYIQYTIY